MLERVCLSQIFSQLRSEHCLDIVQIDFHAIKYLHVPIHLPQEVLLLTIENAIAIIG